MLSHTMKRAWHLMVLFCFLFLLSFPLFPLHANAMSVPRICVVDTRRSSDAASLMSSIRKTAEPLYSSPRKRRFAQPPTTGLRFLVAAMSTLPYTMKKTEDREMSLLPGTVFSFTPSASLSVHENPFWVSAGDFSFSMSTSEGPCTKTSEGVTG